MAVSGGFKKSLAKSVLNSNNSTMETLNNNVKRLKEQIESMNANAWYGGESANAWYKKASASFTSTVNVINAISTTNTELMARFNKVSSASDEY